MLLVDLPCLNQCNHRIQTVDLHELFGNLDTQQELESVCCSDMCGSLQVVSSTSATFAQSSCFSDQIRSVGWHFLEACIEFFWCGNSDMVCSWLYQPRACMIVPEFHLHILSGRSSESESPSRCGLDLQHSRMSKVAHSYCFAVRSVVGLGNTKLRPLPLLGTISCPN